MRNAMARARKNGFNQQTFDELFPNVWAAETARFGSLQVKDPWQECWQPVWKAIWAELDQNPNSWQNQNN